MHEAVSVPAVVSLKDMYVHGQVVVEFQGREVGTRFRDRAKTAWLVLTGQTRRLYRAEVFMVGCNIQGSTPGVAFREALPAPGEPKLEAA